ncbi:hypothetical protein [Wandonia haliotis]|uniref:hypothetical protein n=1 Tax=Wandonia haliotis TaxID=574963 RepID=UPI0031D79A26
MRKVNLVKVPLLVFLFFLLSNCKNEKDEGEVADYKESTELSDSSLGEINSIFSDIEIGGRIYKFDKGSLITPKFNTNFIVDSDTMNFIYLKLYEESDSIVLGVNKLLCYATILPEFEGYYYPNQSVIYPHNFRFLNEEGFHLNINCSNEKDEKFREVGYDKNLLGIWTVDSINPYHKEYKSDLDLKTLTFSRENVLLNDTISSGYRHSGFALLVEGFPYDFHKVLVNNEKMILINTFKDSYEVFYFSKSASR